MKNVLVVGLGRFGRHVAEQLVEMRHQVLAIDIKEDRVDKVLSFVTNAQIGNATNYGFMSTLGVRDFDLCIVAIGDDFQSSLEATSLLKELGARMVVARASRDVHAKFLLRNGADEVVYPERQLANWTAIRYSSDQILNYMELNTEYAIYELEIPKTWIGRSIQSLDVRNKYNINILGVRIHDKMEMNIGAQTVFTSDMTILVLGNRSSIKKCFRL